MAQLQIAFTKKIELKNELITKKSQLKDILADRPDYENINDQIRVLQNKRNQILVEVAEEYPKLADEIAQLKAEIKLQDEMVSDLAVNDYLDKKDITIPDPKNPDVLWEPRLIIKYKKTKSHTLFSSKK